MTPEQIDIMMGLGVFLCIMIFGIWFMAKRGKK
jgi:hypothetical protein